VAGMPMTTKQFLLFITLIYVAGSVVGILVLKGPNLTPQYMEKYGEEHERYLKVLDNEEFHKHEQRPALYPIKNETLAAEFAFAEEYQHNPEFRAEKRRIFYYEWYFKVLNVIVFSWLLVRFVKKPLLEALDTRIDAIRSDLKSSGEDAKQGAALEAAAKAKIDQWAETSRDMRRQTDSVIKENLANIAGEFSLARKQLEKETTDRKQAELYRASRTVRQEIVEEMLREIELRHSNEATQERLADNVNQFVRMMERLS
jgi:F0F1-type ATP synthase membrane subunit b/b'